ncbi:hypothetical protein Hypma_000511 [Hypsizygus marmoreus]|uniref:MARVEL domain-containing protein n=1 Tax=Hypsizygus marmoreus TaxID=39966 RepID=A0A369JFX6_HYPMA|nr:hypothetical protein Hypma_000511 [Hypsizygus marmoreus]
MAFHPLRFALYAALILFAITLIGLTSARINYTRNLRFSDPLHGGFPYYDPIIVELLVTSILAFLWSLPMMFLIQRHASRGFATSYAFEMLGLFILWVMYLVGAAIATNKWRNIGFCRGFFGQCRILTAILAFSWIAWATVTFLLLASLADLLSGHSGVTAPLAGTRAATGPESTKTGNVYSAPAAGAGTGGAVGNAGGYSAAPGATGTMGGYTGGPDTRNLGGAPPVSTGAPVSSNV